MQGIRDAWHQCIYERKVPDITAFTKEVLRLSLPRVSPTPILYKSAIIPAGTSAANYDESQYKEAESFSVERFLDAPPEGALHSIRETDCGFCDRRAEGSAALECNAIPTSLTTEPKPFKVGERSSQGIWGGGRSGWLRARRRLTARRRPRPIDAFAALA